MNIEITDHRKIHAVQQEFSELFPFLKIEFFARPHTSGGPASAKLEKHSSKTLGLCRNIHSKGNISITPEMSVDELKSNFSDHYGLTIVVSRIFGNGWISTEDTLRWSLEKQNREGQQSLIIQETI